MNLLGKGNDPEFWSKTVRYGECYKTYLDFQFKNWNELCTDEPEAALKYTDFKLYAINGDRATFQRPDYRRRVKVGWVLKNCPLKEEIVKYLPSAVYKAVCQGVTKA